MQPTDELGATAADITAIGRAFTRMLTTAEGGTPLEPEHPDVVLADAVYSVADQLRTLNGHLEKLGQLAAGAKTSGITRTILRGLS